MPQEDKVSVFDIFIKHFNAFSESAFQKLSEDQEYRRHAQLYHYTSLQSLQKTIEDQSLRATSIYMLNDPNELIYGHQQISDWFLRDVNDKISAIPRYKSIYGFPAFVFSLTELNDDMYFWEKYGDKHKGIRIGFTPENLIRYWRELHGVQVILTPVIYQGNNQSFMGEYSDEFIGFKEDFVQEINNHISKDGSDYIESCNLAYCSALIASLIKQKEWALEKEWRIVCIPVGHAHESIIGDFSSGYTSARLENKTETTLALLTNIGHDGVAQKDVLKIGSLAGNIEFVQYAIQLLFKKQTGDNYFTDNISQSVIATR